MIIGVDSDWYESIPEYKETYLTSVMKNMDVAVFNAVKSVATDTFAGGTYVGTLSDGGVGIAPFHDLAGKVPAGLQTEIDQLKQDIISGKLKVDDVLNQ